MSRRTKLIIALTLLLLAAATAALLVLTWSPQNPLQFRVVSEEFAFSPRYEDKVREIIVEVENTSATTITVKYAYLYAAHDKDFRRIIGMMGSLVEESHALTLPVEIPPRQTIRHRLVIEPDPLANPKPQAATPTGDIVVSYACASRTRGYALRLVQWLDHYLPESITDHLLFQPNVFGEYRLQPAATTTPSTP